MKQLQDMDEVELRALTTGILDDIQAQLPDGTGFCVLFWPHGEHKISQYGANCRRADMVLALREAADRLERRQDVPR